VSAAVCALGVGGGVCLLLLLAPRQLLSCNLHYLLEDRQPIWCLLHNPLLAHVVADLSLRVTLCVTVCTGRTSAAATWRSGATSRACHWAANVACAATSREESRWEGEGGLAWGLCAGHAQLLHCGLRISCMTRHDSSRNSSLLHRTRCCTPCLCWPCASSVLS
jgi:hypothetical protein